MHNSFDEFNVTDLYTTKACPRFGNQTNFYFPKSSLGTSIKASRYNPIKRINGWSRMAYSERSLMIAFGKIDKFCKKNNIRNNIRDTIKCIYNNIKTARRVDKKTQQLKKYIFRKENKNRLLAGIISFSFKQVNQQKHPREIAKMFGFKSRDVTEGIAMCHKILNMDGVNTDVIRRSRVSTPTSIISDYLKKFDLDDEHIEKVIDITKNIRSLNIVSNHKPVSVAAASTLILFDVIETKYNMKDVIEKYNISSVTLKKVYKKLEQFRDIITDNEKVKEILNSS